MPRAQSKGHLRWTLITTPPANPEAPTAEELNAGIYASCNILDSDFSWTATDSDKIADSAQCDTGNSNAIGASNYSVGFSVFRYFDEAGAADDVEDAVFQAVKQKGTELYAYARETGKLSTEQWAAGDEIYLGGRFVVDSPQQPSDMGGWQKRRVPGEMQRAWENIEVAPAAP